MQTVRWIPLAAAFALALILAPVSPARADKLHEEKSFSASGVQRVKVDLNRHDVIVHARPGSTIEVLYEVETSGDEDDTQEIFDKFLPEYDEGRTLVIESDAKTDRKWWKGLGWGSRKVQRIRVTIEMPPDVELTAGTASGDVEVSGDFGDADVTCGTASGDVIVDGAMANLEAGTASGDVEATVDAEVGTFNAGTASGDIKFRGRAERAHLSTASGDITARDLMGRASLSTASGDIEAVWSRVNPGDEIQVDSASGDIRLILPETAVIDGFIDTASGDIDSDFPGRSDRRHRHFSFDADGDRDAVYLEVDTASGDVEVVSR